MEMKVKPRTGIKVRLEDGSGFVDEKGQSVPQTAYYLRRLADGDLIEVKGK